MTVGIERLKTLYAVLAGVPAPRLNLDTFYETNRGDDSERPEELLQEGFCNTTACAGGWAAVYPEFIAQGLFLDEDASIIYGEHQHFEALAKFFDLPYGIEDFIFGCKDTQSFYSRGLDVFRATDRRVALHRIRTYLLDKGAITKQRSAELMAQEAIQEKQDKLVLGDTREYWN